MKKYELIYLSFAERWLHIVIVLQIKISSIHLMILLRRIINMIRHQLRGSDPFRIGLRATKLFVTIAWPRVTKN